MGKCQEDTQQLFDGEYKKQRRTIKMSSKGSDAFLSTRATAMSEENLNTLESADIPIFFEGFPPLLFPGLSFVFRLSEPGLLVNVT